MLALPEVSTALVALPPWLTWRHPPVPPSQRASEGRCTAPERVQPDDDANVSVKIAAPLVWRTTNASATPTVWIKCITTTTGKILSCQSDFRVQLSVGMVPDKPAEGGP
mmetsp:Transcript_3580/g.11154  ORF Transcript_3580/g.11154 Transcript_3580/m.11154 type:complete len:109 (-) Transcript_3580:148-474(-)